MRKASDLFKMTILVKVAFLCGAVAVILGIWKAYYLFDIKCHSSLEQPYQYLATKSPYIFQEKILYNYKANDSTIKSYIPSGCSAVKIWIVARHGSRNPGSKLIQRMVNEVPLLKDEILEGHSKNWSFGQLCESELAAIKAWKPYPDLTSGKEKWLVTQGYVELHGIAQRLQKQFPDLFDNKYKPDVQKFKYTKTQRAEASAKSFAYGLFGTDEAEKVKYPPALDADPILRFYKGCPKWKKEVDKNPAAYLEKKLFEKSMPFVAMMENMKKRLGVKRQFQIDELELIYMTCSFETAWNPDKVSPWCGLFSEEDFKILEYRQDLEYYWVDGYGYELTYKHACAPIQDVMNQFKEKIEQPDDPHKVTAYFTHSGTLLKFLSHLELFRDSEELRADNFHLHKETRKWRTSFIDKFATNIAFVLFRCSESDTSYKIGTLFQEHVMETKFCGGDWICPFDQFISYFNETVNTCDVSSMCQL